jgi:subtilase family serine protease
MKTSCSLFFVVNFAGLSLLFSLPAVASPPQAMGGHVPAAVKFLTPTGKLSGTNQLQLAIALPLRNQAALSNLLHELYDPASPNFHHYLKPEQFAEQFGPTEADYQVVEAFANANGCGHSLGASYSGQPAASAFHHWRLG